MPPAHFPPLPPQSSRPKNWFDRNWKWFVPALIIFCLLIFGGFIAAILFGTMHMFDSSEPYKTAVERAMKNPEVQAKLGTPITVGRFTSGSINLNGPSGNASIEIPLRGPKGRGVVYIEAKKRAGKWAYETLEFAADDGDRIPLLDSTLPQVHPSPSSAPAGKSDDGTT